MFANNITNASTLSNYEMAITCCQQLYFSLVLWITELFNHHLLLIIAVSNSLNKIVIILEIIEWTVEKC